MWSGLPARLLIVVAVVAVACARACLSLTGVIPTTLGFLILNYSPQKILQLRLWSSFCDRISLWFEDIEAHSLCLRSIPFLLPCFDELHKGDSSEVLCILSHLFCSLPFLHCCIVQCSAILRPLLLPGNLAHLPLLVLR